MLLTNLTIARFQRKIRKFRLARLQSVTYVFRYVFVKKKKKKKKRLKKPYFQLLRKIWWLPHPRPPTRALYAKLQLEKLQFLSLLTTILNALICWKLENFRGLCPLGPRQGLCPCTPPGARKAASGPHPVWEESHVSDTHTQLDCSQSFIIAFSRVFWSVCKTFFRRKSTHIFLARSLRSLDIIFLKFLVF